MTEAVPLLEVTDLTVEFSTRRGIVRAVEHVDVRIAKGEPPANPSKMVTVRIQKDIQ